MLVSQKFLGKTSFTRKGIASVVRLPEKRTQFLYDMSIDQESGVINFENGEGIFMITDKFGVWGSSKFNLFFIDGGMVVELLEGILSMEDLEGNIFYINHKGEVKRKPKKFYWLPYEKMLELASIMVANRYNMDNENDKDLIMDYVNNLAFGFVTEYNSAEDKGYVCFSIRPTDFYLDLGCGKFDFQQHLKNNK